MNPQRTGGGHRSGGMGHRTIAAVTAGDSGGVNPFLKLVTPVWSYSPSLYLPGNNQDAAAGVVIGARDSDNILHGDGETVLMAYVGTLPVAGDPIYLAASQDAANTGLGKITKTLPSLSIPALPQFARERVPLGVCVTTPVYAPAGTVAVLLALPTAPDYGVAPIDSSAVLHGCTFPLVANVVVNEFTAPGGTSQCQLAVGETIIVGYTMDRLDYDPTADGGVMWRNADPVTGFGSALRQVSNGAVSLFYNGISNFVTVSANLGFNIMTLSRPGDGLLHCSMNGTADATAPDTIATAGASGIMHISYTNGRHLFVIKMHKIVTGAQAVAALDWSPILTPYQPPATLITDPQCQWYVDFTSYTGGTLAAHAGPAGTAFNWTTVGTPVVVDTTLNWLRNPAALFLDGVTPTYDSQHLSVARAFQNLQFVLPLRDSGLVSIQSAGKDPDNDDEDAITRFDKPVGGSEVATSIVGSPADGVIYPQSTVYFNATGGDPWTFWNGVMGAGGPTAPITTRIVVSDLIQRIDTFNSGAFIGSIVIPSNAVFQTDAVANRLVLIGDGVTIGGHEQDALQASPSSGAVISRIRADYPGRVTAIACNAIQSIQQMMDWGEGSVVPYARYLYDAAQRGGPTTILYCATFGLYDWGLSTPLATFSTNLALFLSTLHGLDSAKTFRLAKAPQTHLYATPNSIAINLQAYVDLVIAQSGWSLIDVTAPNSMTGLWGGGLNASPLTPTGQIALKGNYKTALGY